MPHKVFTEEDETIDCKLLQNDNNKNSQETNQDGTITFNPEMKFSKYASQRLSQLQHNSSSIRGMQMTPPPKEEIPQLSSSNSLPPKKLSRSTGERRRELPRNRRRPPPDEPMYEEPCRLPVERIDIDIGRMNSDEEDDDRCSSHKSMPVDLTQIVNESVI